MELSKNRLVIDGFVISENLHNNLTADTLFGITSKKDVHIGHDNKTWVLEGDIICDTCYNCDNCTSCVACTSCDDCTTCQACQGCTGFCTSCASGCHNTCFGDCYTCQDCQTGCTGCDGCTTNCTTGCNTSCYSCVSCQNCDTVCQGCDGCQANQASGCTSGVCGGCTSCDSCTGCASCTNCVGCNSCTGCTGCTGCTSCNGGCTGCTGCIGCAGSLGHKFYRYGCASIQTGGFAYNLTNSCGGGHSAEYDPSVNPPPPEIDPAKWQKMSTEERVAELKKNDYEVEIVYRDPNCPPVPELKNIDLDDQGENGEQPNIKTGLVETTPDRKTHVPYYDAGTGEYLGKLVYNPDTGEWNGSVTNPATGKTIRIINAKDDGKGNFISGSKEISNPDGSKETAPANPTDTSTPSTYTPPPTPQNPNPQPQPSGC